MKQFILVRLGREQNVRPWIESEEIRALYGRGFSFFEDAFDPEADLNAIQHHYLGGKWAGIYDFFQQHPDLIDRYEYFWFPDDDIETTPDDAVRFLEIVQQEGFALAQPALRPDSYYAYHITLANPVFRFRRTNFVELMMPIFRRDLLKAVLPLFKDRHAAMGLDFFWHQLAKKPERDVAIIDAVAMGHYRPRQTHLKGRMTAMQVDIHNERDRTMEQFSIHTQPPTTLSGVTSGGSFLKRGPLLWLAYWLGLMQIRRWTTRRPLSFRAIRKHMRSQIASQADLPCFDRAAYNRFLESQSKI